MPFCVKIPLMEIYGELLRSLLLKRGITDPKSAEIFLNPDYERDFHDPFLMRDMERACVRIYEAIDSGQRIAIYADYDCDGIPGAVILQDLFKKVGYTNYEVYIPQRNSEGYGLNMAAIKQFVGSGVKLLITIDLGITAVEEVAQAQVDGIDVIITDHHIPPEVLPRAYAILNPKVDDYPEKMLCGSGVVFKLVQGFLKKYGELFKVKPGAEKWMLDMAGLATLSDMVPLTGENRAIAYFGMKVFRKSPRPGLQKLLAKMKIDQQNIAEDDIGFMVTPKINVASRMDDPMRAFELLSTDDPAQAGALSEYLLKINDDRKTMVVGIMREVHKKLETREISGVLVIGNPEWRVGILGLVAGKLCDEHKRPVFVWGKDENGLIKGSCRSDGSASVVELMNSVVDSFVEFGGHELAGGFTAESEKIHFLESALCDSYKNLKRADKAIEDNYDVLSDLSHVSMKNWRELEKLAPFGLANEKPVFFFENIKINKLKKFGKNGSGEHLEVSFLDKSKEVKAISFFSNQDSFQKPLTEGLPVNLLATFDLSRFRGREELRLRVVDII